jgi:hypothetical protein
LEGLTLLFLQLQPDGCCALAALSPNGGAPRIISGDRYVSSIGITPDGALAVASSSSRKRVVLIRLSDGEVLPLDYARPDVNANLPGQLAVTRLP